MKRVYLMRHAKSSWSEEGMKDHDRPLNPRGIAAAKRMGSELRFRDYVPDAVLCSTAKRTRETLSLMTPEMGKVVASTIEAELYLAGPDLLLDRIRDADNALGSLMIIAHNPGLEELVELLAKRDAAVPDKFPAGALAVLDFDAETWRAIKPHGGEITDVIFPKLLTT